MKTYQAEYQQFWINLVEDTNPQRLVISESQAGMEWSYVITYTYEDGFEFTSWDGGERFIVKGSKDPELCLMWFSMGLLNYYKDDNVPDDQWVVDLNTNEGGGVYQVHQAYMPDKMVHDFSPNGEFIRSTLVEAGTWDTWDKEDS